MNRLVRCSLASSWLLLIAGEQVPKCPSAKRSQPQPTQTVYAPRLDGIVRGEKQIELNRCRTRVCTHDVVASLRVHEARQLSLSWREGSGTERIYVPPASRLRRAGPCSRSAERRLTSSPWRRSRSNRKNTKPVALPRCCSR